MGEDGCTDGWEANVFAASKNKRCLPLNCYKLFLTLQQFSSK